jgi:hypothetical protein
MKILGWILAVMSSINLLTLMLTFNSGVRSIGVEQMSQRASGAIGLLVLGLYLIHKAKKNGAKSEEQDKWMN